MAGSISEIGKLSTGRHGGECCRPNRLPLGRGCSPQFTRFRVLHQRLSAQTIVTPTHFKPFDEKKFAHRRTDLNPPSCSDFIAAPSRACAALASLLAIVHCAGGAGRLLHGAWL